MPVYVQADRSSRESSTAGGDCTAGKDRGRKEEGRGGAEAQDGGRAEGAAAEGATAQDGGAAEGAAAEGGAAEGAAAQDGGASKKDRGGYFLADRGRKILTHAYAHHSEPPTFHLQGDDLAASKPTKTINFKFKFKFLPLEFPDSVPSKREPS